MCSRREKRLIDNCHRLVIAAAGILGLLCDGIHWGDIFCIGSMVLWLAQRECRVIEERVIDQLRLGREVLAGDKVGS